MTFSPPPRCDYCAQRRRGHRPGRLHHQEAEAGSSRVGQAGDDLQRRVAALLLHAVHRGLREHQPGRDQHPLHHRVRKGEKGRGGVLGSDALACITADEEEPRHGLLFRPWRTEGDGPTLSHVTR